MRCRASGEAEVLSFSRERTCMKLSGFGPAKLDPSRTSRADRRPARVAAGFAGFRAKQVAVPCAAVHRERRAWIAMSSWSPPHLC
jgi:hypothetical protein